MSKPKRKVTAKAPEALFGRVVSILEQARGNVVRAVNSNMVLAYWLIGREIVQELQGGEKRAAYGKKLVDDLSARLTERYGEGFSGRNLKGTSGYFDFQQSDSCNSFILSGWFLKRRGFQKCPQGIQAVLSRLQ